jgi:hypothetical protein
VLPLLLKTHESTWKITLLLLTQKYFCWYSARIEGLYFDVLIRIHVLKESDFRVKGWKRVRIDREVVFHSFPFGYKYRNKGMKDMKFHFCDSREDKCRSFEFKTRLKTHMTYGSWGRMKGKRHSLTWVSVRHKSWTKLASFSCILLQSFPCVLLKFCQVTSLVSTKGLFVISHEHFLSSRLILVLFFCLVPPNQVIIMNENGELLSSTNFLRWVIKNLSVNQSLGFFSGQKQGPRKTCL